MTQDAPLWDHPARQPGGGHPVPSPRRRLSLAFEAFHDIHHEEWLRFAQTQTGDRRAAEEVVDAAGRQLAADWAEALRQESVEQYGWFLLKQRVEQWLTDHGRRPAVVETGAFALAVRRDLLGGDQQRFAALEGALSLFTAISQLPERQYDVIVLCCILGYTEQQVAHCTGMTLSTVRSTVRHAKRRLARQLDLTSEPPPGE
ncbi:RNA polymerase sigma factor [Streptomyces sp. NPDC092296]|uniref:RNA polymerase sigma factor n=1 Tax=Streptomyces sp. NPDC092296 TaxID=3366012 RepID=UPI0038132D02